MRRLTARRGRRVLAGAALVTVLVTAGCSRANPSVVAYVGSDGQVTQSQLDSAVAGITKGLQTGQSVQTSAVVSAMIQGEVARQVADANDITITEADREAVLKGSNLAPLMSIPEAKPVLDDVADAQIVPKKVGTDAYVKALQATPVELNPRYGQLSPTDKTVVDGSTGSLSTPAPAAGS